MFGIHFPKISIAFLRSVHFGFLECWIKLWNRPWRNPCTKDQQIKIFARSCNLTNHTSHTYEYLFTPKPVETLLYHFCLSNIFDYRTRLYALPSILNKSDQFIKFLSDQKIHSLLNSDWSDEAKSHFKRDTSEIHCYSFVSETNFVIAYNTKYRTIFQCTILLRSIQISKWARFSFSGEHILWVCLFRNSILCVHNFV